MPFQDYSPVPASNTTIGDDIFIGPNMERAKVRPSLQQIAADGRQLYDTMQSVLGAGVNTDPLLRVDLATTADSKGAALVTAKQSGANTVGRSAQDKLRFIVNAEDFAGTTAEKINRAIVKANADGGGVVDLDFGTYVVLEPILMLPNVTLRGKGPFATIIMQGGTNASWAAFTTSSGIISALTSGEYANIHVEGLSVHGLNSTPVADGAGTYAKNGISLGNLHRSSVKRCFVKDTGTGIVMFGTVAGVNAYRNLIEDCNVLNARSWNAAGNVGAPRGITNYTNRSTVRRCFTDNCYTGFFGGSDEGDYENNLNQRSIDDGFYINENRSTYTNCRSIGADTRAAGSGSGFAVNPGTGVKFKGCLSMRHPNAALRLRHSGAAAPSNISIEDCHFEDCGYGILSDLTGASAWPTGVAAKHIKITGTTIKLCQFSGIKLARFAGGVINGNTISDNNVSGVTTPTRGGISLDEYCINNVVQDNAIDSPSGTQTFAIYSYLAATSGAGSENAGNKISNNIVLFGTNFYFPPLQRGQVTATVTSGAGNRAATGSVTFPMQFEGVPRVKLWMKDATAAAIPDTEFPASAIARNASATGCDYRLDLHAAAAGTRTVVLEYEATFGDLA